MLTLKFGGTSMGSAKRILNSADIIIDRAGKDRVSVVVSAVAGVSNMLADSINDCCSGADAKTYVASVKKIHAAVCSDIGKSCENFDAAAVLKSLQCLFDDYEKMLNAVSAFGECPLSVHCRIMGLGELLSSPIMEAVLKAKKQKVTLLDSRKLIFTTGLQQEGDPDYKKNDGSLCSLFGRRRSRPCAHFCCFPVLSVTGKTVKRVFWEETARTFRRPSLRSA